LLGLVWSVAAPRPAARWTGAVWLAQADPGFGAAQDVWFGLLTAAAGAGVGVAVVAWSGRPRAWRRSCLWLGGCLLGPLACLAVGVGVSGGLGPPAVGVEVVAPLTLTSPGLLAAWALGASLVAMAALGARAAFGRTW
jgi:hypothetical protein